MGNQDAERPKQAARKRKGDGRAAFLSHLDRIKAHVVAGRPMVQYFEEHADALGIGYIQFTRYVERYITAKQEKSATRAIDAKKESIDEQASSRPQSSTGRLPDFKFSPKPVREDLI